MQRIGIYAKKNHPDAVALAREVQRWLQERGIEVFLEQNLARDDGGACGIPGKIDPGDG